MFKLVDSIEQAQLDEHKKPRLFSEDCYLFTPRLVAIADGVTSKADRRVVGSYSSDPEWMSNTVISLLKDISERRKETLLDDPHEILSLLADGIQHQFNNSKLMLDSIGAFEQPSCSLIILYQHIKNPKKYTLINISDGFIFYRDKMVRGSKTLEKIERERIQRIKDSAAKGIRLERTAFISGMRKNIAARNTINGYVSVDLTRNWLKHHEVKILEEEFVSGEQILLTTDGLARLFDLYEVRTSQEFFQQAQTSGLSQMLEEIRELEKEDWIYNKYPRIKTTDDICAMLIEVV